MHVNNLIIMHKDIVIHWLPQSVVNTMDNGIHGLIHKNSVYLLCYCMMHPVSGKESIAHRSHEL